MMSAPVLEAYRLIGPFDADSLPRGLLAEHRLKPGIWGRLTMLVGAIDFNWDDEGAASEPITLKAGDVLMVPPQRPHHLKLRGSFELQIEFLREAVVRETEAQTAAPTGSLQGRQETAPS